jgi:hypothetical protein
MQGSAGHPAPTPSGMPATLAQQRFPRRVRQLLQGILDFSADELGRGVAMALDEYEQALFTHSEQAANPAVRSNYLAALREVRSGREKLFSAFRSGLEDVLASVRELPRPSGPPEEPKAEKLTLSLSLVDDVEIEENIVVNEIANRAEIRNSLPLYLLGQRFGVIASRPAYDVEHLPIGPQQLCRIVGHAAERLDLGVEHRMLLLKQFDRQVMAGIGGFYEALNNYLIGQGILPNLTYVPIRARKVAQNTAQPASPLSTSPEASLPGFETVPHEPRPAAEPAAASTSLADLAAQLAAMPPPPQPTTRWPGQNDPLAEAQAERQDAELFTLLRNLMAGRRALVGKLGGRGATNAVAAEVADVDALQRALSRMQAQAPPLASSNAPRPIASLKQDLLTQLRILSAHGEASALAEPDSDALDLVGLLFEHLQREMRPDSPATPLLGRLQLPLLRVAVGDKGFFTRRQHPARLILNAITDASEFLNPQDEGDRAMLERMRSVADRASREYAGDPALFQSLLAELNQHLQAQTRKAEIAERRHVEAARGREKLEIARLRAAEALDQRLAGRRAPRFLRTLLAQAWSDVLALSLLRDGEDSDAYRRQLAIADRLLDAAIEQRSSGVSPIGAEEAVELRSTIENALNQVGYHGDDAQAITARLLAEPDEDDDDPASSTELAMKLKQRVRFGQDVDPAQHEVQPLLNPAEQEQLEAIQQLPFGTWFEFTVNQQGTVERRRLSWFSTATGSCLFLNHRGQRAGECTLHWLAREVARGNVRILMQPPGGLVDRAWGAIVRALRSFSGAETGAPQ